MKPRRALATVTLVAVLAPAWSGTVRASDPLRPETLLRLSPGDRVRIDTGRHDHLERLYAGLRNDSLGLARSPQDPAREWVRLDHVRRLEIPVGKRRHVLQGMGTGLLLGILAGGVIGAASGASDEDYAPLYVALGMAGGAAGGMALGGVVGAFIRTDRWQSIADDHGGPAPNTE